MPNNDSPKNALRRRIMARRGALSPAEIKEASAHILNRLHTLPAWDEAREVLTYMPIKGEVDVTPLLDELWQRGVRVLLPRCRPGERGIMDVACATCMDDLAPGMYGIPEPSPDACAALPDAEPDIVLVPAVAYDRRGFRLGFGAGFYDRFLGADARQREGKGPLLIGPCYDFQLVDELPDDPWDVPVHAVITENETLWT